METPRYRIHHVAELTGVHPSTLRAWERRYGLLTPHRTPAGHRLYSNADVARVKRVARLASEGIPYPRIPALLEGGEPGSGEPAAQASANCLAMFGERVERHTFGFELTGLEELYRQAVGVFSFEEALDRVFLPLLQALGDRWQAGEDVVAEEHFLSGFVRRKLLACINSVAEHRERPRVVCAVAPGDDHEIGLLIFMLKLTARGIPITYLGPSTPPASLVRVAEKTRATAICLAATVAQDSLQLANVVDDLCALPSPPAVILGGQGSIGFNGDLPAGVLVVGTDAGAGLAQAVAVAATS